jgi:AraC-like DNA-binding protein
VNNVEKFQKIVDTIKTDEVIFATKKPRPQKIGHIQRTEGTRLIIPISGTKNVLIGNEKDVIELNLKKGQVLCIPPVCWDRPLWTTSHKMISIVFKEKYLRLLYINYNIEVDSEWPEPNFTYHLWPGPSASTFHAMQSLTNAKDFSNCNDLFVMLNTCLLRLIGHDLQQTKHFTMGKALSKYLSLSEYVQNHLQNQVTRQDIADIFKITPQYVSYLFKFFHGKSFSDFLTSCRINHATILLLESDMTIDEISMECNYSYTSHFIKMFKRQHGFSPAKYRLANKK